MTGISIIMPVYNAGAFLEESLGDIFSQTFPDYELICVDDGSSDDSGTILEAFARKNERMTVIRQNNQGGGAARNVGMKRACGKYLLFLDADDRFEPELLELAYEKAETDQCDILVYDGDVFDHQTHEHRTAPWLIRGTEEQLSQNPFDVINTSVWNKLFLKRHIESHKLTFQENRIVDTMFFSFLSIVYAKKISVLNRVLYHYRTNNHDSVLSNSDKRPLEAYIALKSIRDRLRDDECYEDKKELYRSFSASFIEERLRLLKTSDGFLKLYHNLHNGGLQELDIADASELTKDISQKTAEEFLFWKIVKLKKAGMLRKETYLLPPLTKKYGNEKNTRLRIAIFGGGNVGRDYFVQIMQSETLRLTAWVDRKYTSIGFPIQSPDVLKNIEFDLVMIAVLDKRVADSIRASLLEMSISDEKIHWEKPRAI